MRGAAALRGRDAEVARITALLEALGRGVGGVLVIEGEAGIGKSRLVETLVAAADQARFETYVGRTSEIDRSQPLVAVADALSPLRADLPGVIWGEESDGPRGLRLLEVATDELERRSIRRPVVLCLEDVHWADADTLQFAQVAARRTASAPLAVVLTTRPVEGIPAVAQLADRLSADGAAVIVPSALPPDAVADLVADVLGAAPSARLLREVARANGNPFYVRELVAALAEAGALDEGAELDHRSAALPASFRLVVLRRLATLPSETLDDLRVAAILGTSFSLDDLAIVVERSAIDMLRTLGPALAAGFVEDGGEGRLAFSHDLVRSTLYEDVPSALRRSIHARIGRALADAGRPAVAVASHVAIAAEPGDGDAVEMLVRATIDVAKVSFEAMLVYLEHAVRLCAPDHPRFFPVASQLVAVLLNVGRWSDAEVRARQILDDEPDIDSRAFAATYLAEALTARGSLDEVATLLRTAADEQTDTPGYRAVAAAELARNALLRGDLAAAERISQEAASVEGGLPLGRLGTSYVRCLVAAATGRAGEAAATGADVANLEDECFIGEDALPTTRTATALALAEVDRTDEALEHLGLCAQRLDDTGSVLSATIQHVSSWIRYATGDWDGALVDAEFTTGLDADRRFEAGFSNEFAMFSFAVAARIALHRDDVAGARQIVERGERWIAAGVPRLDAGAFDWVRAVVREATGDAAGALDTMAQTWLTGEPHRFIGGVWRFLAPEIVRFALDAGRRELADAVAMDVEHLTDERGSSSLAAMRIRALAADDGASLADVSRGLYAAGRTIESASAAVEAAISLGRVGSSASAELFNDALARFEALGATRSVRRTRALMRTFGVRAGARGRRGRPTTGWDALTATERQIVALVGEGLTNGKIGERLFISPRTVQTHLRNVFGKLGASSRAEVAAEAVRRS